jgi:hypothetical protein
MVRESKYTTLFWLVSTFCTHTKEDYVIVLSLHYKMYETRTNGKKLPLNWDRFHLQKVFRKEVAALCDLFLLAVVCHTVPMTLND